MLYLQSIRSLGAKFDELNVEHEILNIKPRFLFVTETWLRKYSKLNIFCQDKWKSIEKRNGKAESGGGVAALNAQQSRFSTNKTNQKLQILTVKTNVPKWKKLDYTLIY